MVQKLFGGVLLATVLAVGIANADALPDPWKFQDIGGPGVAGSATYDNGVFTIKASGADVWDTADKFGLVSQPLSGDGYIVAQVQSLENTNDWAKAGVMIRESNDPGSVHAFMCITPGNGASFQRRPTAADQSKNDDTGGISAPYWVKLTRVGTDFTGYISKDGKDWQKATDETITMKNDVLIGLAVTSHDDGTLTTAKFSDVKITKGKE